MTRFNSIFLKFQNYFLGKKKLYFFDKYVDKLKNHLTTKVWPITVSLF